MMAPMILLLLLGLSLLLRIQHKKRSATNHAEIPEHAKPSPFSEALQELIGTAGGIYLSLVLLVSFLQIDLADKLDIYGVHMDPLAFTAIILSVVQPLILRVRDIIREGS